MKKAFFPVGRIDNVIEQEIAGELLIYDLENDRALCLNGTAALVWKACDGTKTADDISCELSLKLNSKVTEDVIYLALDELSKQNLLIGNQLLETELKKHSRRDLIKKIGLTTGAVLPIILSLNVPSPAQASSCGKQFDRCAAPSDPPCCPGLTCSASSIGGSFCDQLRIKISLPG